MATVDPVAPISQIHSTIGVSNMEGVIACKSCNLETPKCNRHCLHCSNEIGERCWRCNYLGKVNSKFCFKCNVKLNPNSIPSRKSIRDIPSYTITTTTSTLLVNKSIVPDNSDNKNSRNASNNNNNTTQNENDSNNLPNIRSIIESINTRNKEYESLDFKSKKSSPAKLYEFRKESSLSNLEDKQKHQNNNNNNSNSNSNSNQQVEQISTLLSSSTRFDENGRVVEVFFNNPTITQEQIETTKEHNKANENASSSPYHEPKPKLTYTSTKKNIWTTSSDPSSPLITSTTIYCIDGTNSSEVDTNSSSPPPITSSPPRDDVLYRYENDDDNQIFIVDNVDDDDDDDDEIFSIPNNSSATNNINQPVALGSTQKRKSFNGVGSNSVLNEIIGALPSPPSLIINNNHHQKNRNNTNSNGNSNSNTIVVATPLSPTHNSTVIINDSSPTKFDPTSSFGSNSSVGSTKSDHRSNLIKEIISTELDYINDLDTIINVFCKPIKEFISNEESANIFSNIEQILSVSRELYEKLTDSSFTIGQIFSSIADSLGVYSVYCNYHQKSLDCLNTLLKMPNVEQFCNEMNNKNELRGMGLNSFLIKPVQRICKYPLLLKELLKATPEDHLDYKELILAVEKIEKIVNTINTQKKEMETWQRTMQLIQSLKGAENLSLLAANRHLICEGQIHMVFGFSENSEKKYSSLKFKKGVYFLFNDLFLFTKQKGTTYKLVISIPLETILVHSNLCVVDKQLFSMVEIGTGGRKWTFCPVSKNQNIVFTIQKLIEKAWEDKYQAIPNVQSPPIGTPDKNDHSNNGANSLSSIASPNGKKKLSHRLVKSLVNIKTL
ncbi:hypothetical protein CYY_008798 [Polysphondylium violaceum]|uniref:DH domain-containing protein n=1 Tax=Polysphondylium violaceum TaxID=133409 RepID=A0A8J4PMJ5_9MYCE|nr:hypothetical protein CYY_008798 [Polysphondylium violaceum]